MGCFHRLSHKRILSVCFRFHRRSCGIVIIFAGLTLLQNFRILSNLSVKQEKCFTVNYTYHSFRRFRKVQHKVPFAKLTIQLKSIQEFLCHVTQMIFLLVPIVHLRKHIFPPIVPIYD